MISVEITSSKELQYFCVCVFIYIYIYKMLCYLQKKRLIQYDRNLLMLINNYSQHLHLYEHSHNINLMAEYKKFTRQTVLSVSARKQ